MIRLEIERRDHIHTYALVEDRPSPLVLAVVAAVNEQLPVSALRSWVVTDHPRIFSSFFSARITANTWESGSTC